MCSPARDASVDEMGRRVDGLLGLGPRRRGQGVAIGHRLHVHLGSRLPGSDRARGRHRWAKATADSVLRAPV